jgi:hypothetical protein
MMDAIWSTTMKTIYERYHRRQQSTVLADVPFAKFKERQKASQRFCVFESKASVYQVQVPDSGLKFTVNLIDNWCSCRNFWEYHGPCSHAITACRCEAEDPFTHFAATLKVNYYRRTYEVAMPPISVENLLSDPDILPPLLVKKRGRPRQKRMRKGGLKRKQTRCTNCLQTGHNKRRCVEQPARNGRAERARDWVSDTDSELERELAPFIEAARAKAKGVEDSDKEPELSDLRSSDFEAIEADIAQKVSSNEVGLQLRPQRARRVPLRLQD